MKFLAKCFVICFATGLLILVLIPLYTSKQALRYHRVKPHRTFMQVYRDNQKKHGVLKEVNKQEISEILRWQRVDSTSLEKLRSKVEDDCTKIFNSAQKLRNLELEFLRTLRAKSTHTMLRVRRLLATLKITVDEEEDLAFLQDVTWSEVDDMVNTSAEKAAELMGQCNETHSLLQALNKEKLSANYTLVLNESFAAVKQRGSETISKVYNHIRDLKELFTEFAEYVIALANQFEKRSNARTIEREFKNLARSLIAHKNKVFGARRNLLSTRRMFSASVENLQHKLLLIIHKNSRTLVT